MEKGNAMFSTDFAAIEIDKNEKHLIVNAKKSIGSGEMRELVNIVVKETNTRALDVAANWTMKINHKPKTTKNV